VREREQRSEFQINDEIKIDSGLRRNGADEPDAPGR
jgi:hypothetical protein